jgi:hypothetical protein
MTSTRQRSGTPARAALACAFVVLSGIAMAQPKGQPVPNADQRGRRVIDDAVAALGGSKFLAMEDRIESGRAYSFYREQLSGLSIARIYTRYLAVAPNKTGEDLGVRERQAFGKNDDWAVVFREDGAWELTYRGAKELPSDRFERYRDSTLRDIFYLLRQRLDEKGMTFESRGLDVFENLPVEIVDITDSQDRTVTVYFHQSTKLPVGQKYSWRDPKTKERNDEVSRFARYREVNGIQWPQQITRERNGDKIYEIFSDSVTFNQDLTDDLFNPTAVQKDSRPKKK